MAWALLCIAGGCRIEVGYVMTYGLHDYYPTAFIPHAQLQLQALVGAQLDWSGLATQEAAELNRIADRYETADAYAPRLSGRSSTDLPSLCATTHGALGNCAHLYARQRVDFGAAPAEPTRRAPYAV